jgi:hypothetical protein
MPFAGLLQLVLRETAAGHVGGRLLQQAFKFRYFYDIDAMGQDTHHRAPWQNTESFAGLGELSPVIA